MKRTTIDGFTFYTIEMKALKTKKRDLSRKIFGWLNLLSMWAAVGSSLILYPTIHFT